MISPTSILPVTQANDLLFSWHNTLSLSKIRHQEPYLKTLQKKTQASAIFISSLPKIPSDPSCSFPAPRFLSNMCICLPGSEIELISSASLIGNDISILSVVVYRKKLTTKNCNDSWQGNLRSLYVRWCTKTDLIR